MINTGVYRNNFVGYAFKRVMIAVISFFIISILVTFSIYVASVPEPELIVLEISDILKMSQEEMDALREGPDVPYYAYLSYPEYYVHSMGGFFTGDWGESVMPASYYSE
jgi:ABC-type dipeptide/oligopeptide/nickel transport system permease component